LSNVWEVGVIASLYTLAAPPPVDLDEVVDRSLTAVANRLGRCPTVAELAHAAGLEPEQVLEVLEAGRDAPPHGVEALRARCAGGQGYGEIAARLAVSRLGVSKLLRSAVRVHIQKGAPQ
jgi:DNA-directed RNA polymerase specialized sigma subunit